MRLRRSRLPDGMCEVRGRANGSAVRIDLCRCGFFGESRMSKRLSFRFFAHSWISDWNHGNAHLLRGLASELVTLGNEVRCYEERDSWSMKNLANEGNGAAAQALIAFRHAFPMLDVRFYTNGSSFRQFAAEELRGADVVIVHEWNSPEVVETLLSLKRQLGFRALFHDTHHRDCKSVVHGVRYPENAPDRLSRSGIEYRGYLPNLRAPHIYARSKISLHVPRKFYANGLSGVPTIRVFEALAAGSPLVCAPWSDSEGLFRPGEDYICVPDGAAMIAELRYLLGDEKARKQLAENGRGTVLARHTCAHRAAQLVDICHELEN